MGIKDLWSLLTPYCERKPLYELEGKVVAIDLSGWVCDSLNVVDYHVQPRMHLKNLFFRTCYLLLSGVTPVFVLEGEAPAIKYGVICKRNEIQFRGAKPKNSQIKKPDKGRSRFNNVLKQCEELINSMGIECVQGPGEAEAFCAYLNQDGLVDGVISQDSDCFGYGAERVYRNFSVSQQGRGAAVGGAIDVYDMKRVREQMDLGQEKMVVLALLCGCDYCPEGIGGIGKDSVLKLFKIYKNDEILDKIKSWRINESKYSALELRVDDKGICTNCGHLGRTVVHTKSGCSVCRMSKGCNADLWKEQRLTIKAELSIRNKALSDQNFPSQEIIDEFMDRPTNLPPLNLKWKQPNLVKFLKFMSKLLQWEELYCLQKFLPLLTRWQLINNNSTSSSKGIVHPDYIKKKRTPKGIASYEIVWKDKDNCFTGLIPDSQITNQLIENPESSELLWTTIEPANLVEITYPDLVEQFLESKKKKKPVKEKKKRKTNDKTPRKNKKAKESSLNDMSGILEEIVNIKKTVKPRKKKETVTKPINEFFNVQKDSKACSLDDMSGILGEIDNIEKIIKPKRKKPIKKNDSITEMLDFDDDADIDIENMSQFSDILSSIVNSSPLIKSVNGKRLIYQNVSPLHKKSRDDLEIGLSSKKNIFPDLFIEDLNRSMENISVNKTHKTSLALNKFFERQGFMNSTFDEQEPEAEDREVKSSSFFGNGNNELDVFEQSLIYKEMDDDVLSIGSNSSNDTIEYEFDMNEKRIVEPKLHDTFDMLVNF